MKTRKFRTDAVDEEICRLLEGGSRRVAELKAALKTPYSTLHRRLKKLSRYGLVTYAPYKPVALTGRGRRWLAELEPAPIEITYKDARLEGLVDLLPTEPHKAAFRLALDLVAAKRHLFARYNQGWPSFILWGRTKGYKTGLGLLLARLLGLKLEDALAKLYYASPGNPGYRKVQKPGGKWSVETSHHYALPIAILDEWDKVTDRETRLSVLSFLDDTGRYRIEDEIIDVRCVPFLTANIDGEKALGDRLLAPFIRRGFVFNADSVRGELGDVQVKAREIEDFMRRERLKIDLDKLRPAIPELDREHWDLLNRLLMREVAGGYEHLVDTQPVMIAACGRSALVGPDPKECIFQALYDRLVLLETLGGAKEGWRERLYREWGKYRAEEQPHVLEQIKRNERRRREREEKLQQHQEALQQAKVEKLQKQFQFQRRKGDLIAILKQLRVDLYEKPPTERGKRATMGLRRSLELAIKKAEACRDEETLERIRAAIEPYVLEAREVIARAETERVSQRARSHAHAHAHAHEKSEPSLSLSLEERIKRILLREYGPELRKVLELKHRHGRVSLEEAAPELERAGLLRVEEREYSLLMRELLKVGPRETRYYRTADGEEIKPEGIRTWDDIYVKIAEPFWEAVYHQVRQRALGVISSRSRSLPSPGHQVEAVNDIGAGATAHARARVNRLLGPGLLRRLGLSSSASASASAKPGAGAAASRPPTLQPPQIDVEEEGFISTKPPIAS